MNGSWHLGKLAGIDLRIHWTFLLLPTWIYFSSVAGGGGAAAAAISVIFVLAIFGCVVLHELGHALAARQFGIPTRDITLLPIGGVARLESMPRNPLQEFVIAIAGPAVNVVIATAIFAGLVLSGLSSNFAVTSLGLILRQLAWVNVGLVVFNLIPAFPMDGGRVLRSLLATGMSYGQATNIASGVGQVAAVGLGMLGLFSGNLMLVLIAGFVFLAARSEAFAASQPLPSYATHVPFDQRRLARQSEPFYIGDDHAIEVLEKNGSMAPPRPIIGAECSAQSAFDWLGQSPQVEFPVIKHGEIIGLIGKSDLQLAIVSGRGYWPIERLLDIRFMPHHGLHLT